jgi:hypothetical protein
MAACPGILNVSEIPYAIAPAVSAETPGTPALVLARDSRTAVPCWHGPLER